MFKGTTVFKILKYLNIIFFTHDIVDTGLDLLVLFENVAWFSVF